MGTDRGLDFRLLARTWLAGLEYFGINPPFMEPEHLILPQLVKPGDTALDIGANVGAYTCQLSRLVGPLGNVTAFEPYPPSFSRLASLVRFLSLTNVTLRNIAITESSRTVRLARPRRAIGGALHGFVHEATEWSPMDVEVTGHTLDEEVDQLGLNHVNFIKCDVEGAEAAVFAGGQNTIGKHRPIVICEIEDRWTGRYGAHRSDVVERLRELGRYKVFTVDGHRIVPWGIDRDARNNVIFLPAQ